MKKVLIIFYLYIFISLIFSDDSSKIINDLSNDLVIQKNEINKLNKELNSLKNEISNLDKKIIINKWLEWAKIILPLFALILSFCAYRNSKKDGEFHRFYNLITEYQTDEFGKNIIGLWDYYKEIKKKIITDNNSKPNEIEKEIKEKIILDYKSNYEDKYKNNLDLVRRKVSNYYIRIWTLLKKGKIKDDILTLFWDKDNVRIIDKILIPMEESLVIILLKTEDKNIIEKKLKPFRDLYQRLNKNLK